MGILSWTQYSPLENGNSLMDPLAFDYFAQQLGNEILPSFTTRTERARYYTVVLYGLYLAQKYLKETGDGVVHEKDILEYFKKYERLWAKAVVCSYDIIQERDEHETGLRGKRGAIANREKKSLDYQFLTRQLELGGLGAYRSSLEDLGLLNENLKLTQKGLRIIETINSKYEYWINDSINTQKVTFLDRGPITFRSFGKFFRLDSELTKNKERNILISSIIENPKNYQAINYICTEFERKHDITVEEVIKNISEKVNENPENKSVIESFITIRNFENLAIVINYIFSRMFFYSSASYGSVEVKTLLQDDGIKNAFQRLSNESLISKILESPKYSILLNKTHGNAFHLFLKNFSNFSIKDSERFLIQIIDYHQTVMKKRNVNSWLICNGNNIDYCMSSNYGRGASLNGYLHSYKIYNIINIAKDLGWNSNER